MTHSLTQWATFDFGTYDKPLVVTCDLWDIWSEWWYLNLCELVDISDSWELGFMTFIVSWQLRVTLGSICNSCYVWFGKAFPFFYFSETSSVFLFVFINPTDYTGIVAEYILLFEYTNMFHCSFTVINILENTWVTCQCQYLGGCRVGHREGGVGVGQAKNIKD